MRKVLIAAALVLGLLAEVAYANCTQSCYCV